MNNVEKQFDNLFSKNSGKKYTFNFRTMSRKDRGIITCLKNYGIEGKRILDVGPGTGRWIQFVKQNKPAYISAIDISEESLKRCMPFCNHVQKANLETDKFNFENNSYIYFSRISIPIRISEIYMYFDILVYENTKFIYISI